MKAQVYDNIYIKSLQRKLPPARKTERIDLLNEISFAWQNYTDSELVKLPGWWVMKRDSTIKYARIAKKESVTLAYRKGEGMALVNQTNGQFFSWWDEKGFPKTVTPQLLDSMDKNLTLALSLLDSTDHNILGQLFGLWGDIARKKSRSDLMTYGKNMKESIRQYELAGNKKLIAESCTWVSFDYIDAGYLGEALDFSLKGLQYGNEWTPADSSTQNREWKSYIILQSLYNLSDISRMGGDYNSALKYLHDANDYAVANKYDWIPCSEICEVYISMGNADSALAYQQNCAHKNANPLDDDALGRIYVMKKEYDKAIPILLNISSKMSNRPRMATETACELGKAYAGKGNYREAQKYAYLALERANEWGKRAYTMPAYELLSNIHHTLGNNDSAYLYLNKFMLLKDSIQNAQFRWQLQKVQ